MSINQYLTRFRLGETKAPQLLQDKGEGYLFEKNGALTALYHNGEPMRFLAYIEFAPGISRGDHVHLKKVEHFVLVKGEVRARYLLPDDPDVVTEIALSPGDGVVVQPGLVHSYISREGATALEFSAQPFEIADTTDFDVYWD